MGSEMCIRDRLKGTGFTRKGVGKYAIDDVSSFISQSLDKKYSDVVLRLQRAETYVIFPSSSSSALIGLSLSN